MTDTLLPTTRHRAHDVALGELDAFLALLRDLDTLEWQAPTDCAGWTVRDVVAHVAGALEEGAHLRAQLRRVALAPRRYPSLDRLDAINQLQVDDRGEATLEQLVAEIAALGPKAARARRRLPRPLRRMPIPAGFGLPRGSTFAYLVDVIYPRDLWMHRIDVARATGRELRTSATEADVVAQVVRDLAHAWEGHATTLTLTGHGAGSWTLGVGSPRTTLEADAVQICRMLSGRAASPRITRTGDPDAEHRLVACRISF